MQQTPRRAQRLFAGADCVGFIDRRGRLWTSDLNRGQGKPGRREERCVGPARAAHFGEYGCWRIDARGRIEHLQGAPGILLDALGLSGPQRLIEHPEGRHFRTLAVGERHLVAIDSENRLWGWGSNGAGQLASAAAAPPSEVRGKCLMSGVLDVAATRYGTLIVADTGRLSMRGLWDEQPPCRSNAPKDDLGPCGVRLRWVCHAQGLTLVQGDDGSVHGAGSMGALFNPYGREARYDFAEDWFETGWQASSKAATGGRHLGCITLDGELRVRGDNTWGQLGQGHTTSTFDRQPVGADYVEVACGPRLTVALHRTGAVYLMGLQALGPSQARSGHVMALRPTSILEDASRVL